MADKASEKEKEKDGFWFELPLRSLCFKERPENLPEPYEEA